MQETKRERERFLPHANSCLSLAYLELSLLFGLLLFHSFQSLISFGSPHERERERERESPSNPILTQEISCVTCSTLEPHGAHRTIRVLCSGFLMYGNAPLLFDSCSLPRLSISDGNPSLLLITALFTNILPPDKRRHSIVDKQRKHAMYSKSCSVVHISSLPRASLCSKPFHDLMSWTRGSMGFMLFAFGS